MGLPKGTLYFLESGGGGEVMKEEIDDEMICFILKCWHVMCIIYEEGGEDTPHPPTKPTNIYIKSNYAHRTYLNMHDTF